MDRLEISSHDQDQSGRFSAHFGGKRRQIKLVEWI